jgi:hypothetical protein
MAQPLKMVDVRPAQKQRTRVVFAQATNLEWVYVRCQKPSHPVQHMGRSLSADINEPRAVRSVQCTEARDIVFLFVREELVHPMEEFPDLLSQLVQRSIE